MSARKADGRSWVKWGAAGVLLLTSLPARASDAADAKSWQLEEQAKSWQHGEPAPVGYHVGRKHTLGIVGGSILAGGYLFSALSGLAFLSECHIPGSDNSSCTPNPETRAAPFLFIPIAGPFLTFTNSHVRDDGGAVFWFSVFGAAQVAGAGLLVYDLAVPQYGLKRGEEPAAASGPRLYLTPMYWGRGPGLALLGEF